jgi:hypothetical protein
MSAIAASTMAIKELAGHQQISTTQRYMHPSPAAKSAAIRLLDRGADRLAEDLKDTENRGDTVETPARSPQMPSNPVQIVWNQDPATCMCYPTRWGGPSKP